MILSHDNEKNFDVFQFKSDNEILNINFIAAFLLYCIEEKQYSREKEY